MNNSKYKALLAKARKGVPYWSQIAKRDFTDDLLLWMERATVSQSELAARVGVTPQFITKVLRTNANLTIETMTKFALALGCQVRIHVAEKDAETEWVDSLPAREKAANEQSLSIPKISVQTPTSVPSIVRNNEAAESLAFGVRQGSAAANDNYALAA